MDKVWRGHNCRELTGVELYSLLSDLRTSANKLSSETSSVNAIIDGVEAQLIGMNLGLEYWLKSPGLDSQSLDIWTTMHTQLGFAKFKLSSTNTLASGRTLSPIRRRSYRILCARFSIKALELIPKLIEELKESAEKATSTIVNAKKLLGLQQLRSNFAPPRSVLHEAPGGFHRAPFFVELDLICMSTWIPADKGERGGVARVHALAWKQFFSSDTNPEPITSK